MARYFIDTEFLEGTQKTFFGKSKPTIDLISIGLVSDDGREYYAISKDFNLKEAWDWQEVRSYDKNGNLYSIPQKEYWIRDNVLLPIYIDHVSGDNRNIFEFSYSTMKWILSRFGKSNKQISDDIIEFCESKYLYQNADTTTQWKDRGNPEFYGYYCSYDWVVFCWLFGKMIDLPKGFPMYCRDLKQTLDEKQKSHGRDRDGREVDLTKTGFYPKQSNEHNALDDARFNMELYKFLEKL